MKYRRFGRTNIQMPVFSCGGMRYQYKWHDRLAEEIPAENQANVEAIVARALELGINHFETARVYGSIPGSLPKSRANRERLADSRLTLTLGWRMP